MDLALLGLGLKRLSFNTNAGPQEISAVIYDSFPQLSGCGYKMLRSVTQKLIRVKIDPAGSLLVAIIDPAGSLLAAKSDPPLQKVIRVQILVDSSLF